MLHLGVPVRVGGLMVNQGDLLHGDANGVTNIPPEIADEVAEVGDAFVAAEAIMLDYVKAPGAKDVKKYDALRKEFQSVVAKLQQRVSRAKK
jgi:regulator of RNase E activity RraA